MKKSSVMRLVLRVWAILLLGGMFLPQFAACTKKNGDGSETTASPKWTIAPDADIPKKLALKTAAGFLANGNALRMNITGENAKLDLSDRFEVALGTKWVLATDEAGKNELSEKSITLKEGENVFYVKTSFGEETFVYQATVNYRAAYLVEFCTNSNDEVETQAVAKGERIERPVSDPVRAGYAFKGWYLNGEPFDFSQAPAKSMTLIAHWQKNDTSINGYYTSSSAGKTVTFTGVSAGLHVVWKDYGNSNGVRPAEVTCVLVQFRGTTQKSYEIILKRNSVAWKNENNKPSGGTLAQGEGGNWTLSLKNLPETVGAEPCSYQLSQVPLSGDYTTRQSGTEVVNTVRGYVPRADSFAKLTTRNSRLYDAAGNMIVFKGVVTYNLGQTSTLDNDTSLAALQKLAAYGCNALRVSAQLIGTAPYVNETTGVTRYYGNGYVYYSNGNARTGAYGDGDERVREEDKRLMMEQIDGVIERATQTGLYVIIDWAILTSNPYQYLNEARDFFGTLAGKYADNPYVLFEICNEPAGCGWGWGSDSDKTGTRGKGIKGYAEAIIDFIRANGSNAIIVVAPRGAAVCISQGASGSNAGDDPIYDPLDDDRRCNVAYTFHCYPFENTYAVTGTSLNLTGFGWRLRDAHDAGLTIITTEFSPMASAFDYRDYLGYDMEQMKLYVRLFQEYDVNFFYFRYGSIKSEYSEWFMFKPNAFSLRWTRNDLSDCGKWYFDLITGNGAFVTELDYNAVRTQALRDKYQTTFAAYGLEYHAYADETETKSDKNIFTPFPSFAKAEGVKSGSTYYFKVNGDDTVSDAQYEAYCKRFWRRVSEICDKSGDVGKVYRENGALFTEANVPVKKTDAMELTYVYHGTTVSLKIAYGQNTADLTWGIFLTVQ
ncbi:MAG: cellulase family glycosylhydrolase [Clostridia bacterium]|nr:cellulase family glycosylhydrolase [Clostridia bacterium]